MKSYSDENLYNSISELKIVDQQVLDECFKHSQSAKIPLDEILIEKDLMSDAAVGRIVGDLISVPYISLATTAIPDSARYIIPEDYARLHKVVVFADEIDVLKMAMNNPLDVRLIKFVEKKANKKVVPYFTTRREIEEAMKIYKKDLQKSFTELLKEQVDIVGDGSSHEAPIIKIVDLIIEYAYSNKASDIHIEPEKESAKIRFRIDGVMHEVLDVSLEIYKQIILRIKVLAKLSTDEHLSAQDGKLKANLLNEDLDIRVSLVPITHGEKAVLRLLASHFRQFSLSNLGMSQKDYEKVYAAINKPYGMILSTGPTGSGKTTSMYAILKILNTSERNIATIEDPVEYEIEGVNQIQVNPKTNLTFAEGLRSILRQDPNVIYVGEIRDEETAGIAVNSAMTGHIVLSTLHTNDAVTAIPRFIEMGVEPYLIASTVNVVVAQRLVRKICDKCKFSKDVKREDLIKDFDKEIVDKIWKDAESVRVYQGKGCALCHMTGYLGRVGIFEVLELNQEVRDLIDKKASADTLKAEALKSGMTRMLEDGLLKVAQGLTTFEEVLRATIE